MNSSLARIAPLNATFRMIAACLAAAFLTTAVAQEEDTLQLRHSTDPKGTVTIHSVSEERASMQPQWDPETQPPPLAINKAAAISKDSARKLKPEAEDFEVWGIDIWRIPSDRFTKRWCYVFKLQPVVEQRYISGQVAVFVLMDGTIVEPVTKSK